MRSLSKGLRAALFATALLTSSAAASGGFLGVQVNDAANGVRILSVREGSPAAQAGLVADDQVAAVGDRAIASADDLAAALGKLSAGDKVTLKVKRGDQDHVMTVTLGDRPSDGAGAPTTSIPALPITPPAAEVPTAAPTAPVAAGKAIPAIPLVPMPAEPVPNTTSAATAPSAPGLGMIASEEAPRKGGFLGVTLGGEGGDNTIAAVVDGSPAAKANLKSGDQIVAVDGKETASAEEVSKILSTKQPGDGVEVTVLRDGKRKLRTATLAEYGAIDFAAGAMTAPATIDLGDGQTATLRLRSPEGGNAKGTKAAEPKAASGGRGWLGVYLNQDDGTVVDSLADESPAGAAGIQPGDKILKVGGKTVNSTDELIAALEGKAGRDIAILVKRGDEEKRIGVTLGTPPAEFAVGGMEPPAANDDDAVANARKAGKAAREAETKAKNAAKEAEAKAEKAAKAAEKAEKQKEESAAKRAQVKAKAAEERAKVAEKRAKVVEERAKSKAPTSATTQRWFFPAGTQLSLRVEEKGDGFWITAGNGSQGIHVPADGSTNVTLEGKGEGIEVRTSTGSMEPKVFSFSTMGGGDAAAAGDGHGVVVLKGEPGDAKDFVVVRRSAEGGESTHTVELEVDGATDEVVTAVMGEGDKAPKIVSRRKMTDAEKAADHGVATFTVKGSELKPKILELEGGGDGEFVFRGSSLDEWTSDIKVEKGDLHVVPHPPVHGGGIHITNNGGTVIIGDAAAHAFLAGHHPKVDVLMKDHAGADEKVKVLKELGYIGGEKAQKNDAAKDAKKTEKKKSKDTD